MYLCALENEPRFFDSPESVVRRVYDTRDGKKIEENELYENVKKEKK